MPFTFSHPAVVLPLTFKNKYRFSATALTIGSMTPDFEYFINFEQQSNYSHTWLGIFWFDLPLSVFLFYVYTELVKDELIDNLPAFLNRRFSRFKTVKRKVYSTQQYLIIFTSLLIGITSHLFWDKLMHRSVQIVEDTTEVYPIFWDANSVIGASVIAFIIWKLPKGNLIKQDSFLFWSLTLLTILIILRIRYDYNREIRNFGVASISGLFIGLIIASFAATLIKQKKT